MLLAVVAVAVVVHLYAGDRRQAAGLDAGPGTGAGPSQPDPVLGQFNHLVSVGTPESLRQAERLLRGALPNHPHKDRIYAALGMLETQRATRASNVLGAIRPPASVRELFHKALRINPRNLQALRGLASYHEFHNQPRKAMAMDDRIIAAHPGSLNAWSHKGRCLLMLRDHAGAEKVLQEALRRARAAKDPRAEVAARELLGTAYTRQGKYGLAEKVLLAAVKQAEASRVAACPYAALGELYHVTGRQDKVAQVHIRAAEMEAHKPKMQFNAAQICHQMGDFDNALKYINRAIALHDDQRYRQLKRQILADRKPRAPGVEFSDALAAFQARQYTRAKRYAERALEGAQKAEYRVLMGFVLLLEKQYSQAEALFSQARTGPRDTGASTGLGHVAIIRKQYPRARRLLQPGIEEGQRLFDGKQAAGSGERGYPWLRHRMACLGMGWVMANTGHHPAAMEQFDRILAGDPKDTFALLGKGNSLNATGKLADAETYLRRVLALDPTNRFALAELALVKYNRGQDAESEKLFLAALKGDERRYTCPHEGLGMIYLRAGKLERAKESFRRAIKINPNIEYKKFNGLARIFIREGKYKRARVLLRKSMANYPYDGEAKKLLASIKGK